MVRYEEEWMKKTKDQGRVGRSSTAPAFSMAVPFMSIAV